MINDDSNGYYIIYTLALTFMQRWQKWFELEFFNNFLYKYYLKLKLQNIEW